MEVVIQPIVSELFKGLLEILGSEEVRHLARQLVGEADSELEKLIKKLRVIQRHLSSEEERQRTDEAIKEWLDDLRDWAYDAEDILDEFAYEALRRKLKAEHQTRTIKVFNLVPACFSRSRFHVRMGSQIKGLTSRLEQLCKRRSFELELQGMSSGVTSRNSAQKAPEQRTTSSSVPTEQVVYGREEDKAKILQMVLSDEPSDANFYVIAIVGMGGIGKTTLARAVYNDRALDIKFEKKAWCCVSDNFDVLRISKELLMSINPSSSSLNNLNEVQVELQKAVNAKKFLLILDDVWEVDYDSWVQLKAPFMTAARGSMLIVTTRDNNVALTIRSSYSHYLNNLSAKDCWNLFLEHAFGTGTNGRAYEIPHSVRKRVVQRCGGLPLAAKTLGGLLGNKQIDGWEKILSSEMWDSTITDSILPVLKLSYHHLPSRLKRCFAYCAVYPKDYEFEEKKLILLWMAEGIVQQLDVAGEYFRHLLSRSLFQQSSSNCCKYIMHDLVHDLAQSVFGKIGFRLEKTEKLLDKFKRIQHFSYIPDYYDGKNKFKDIENFRSLRTFLRVVMRDNDFSYITVMFLFDLLPKLKKLRILSLSNYYITKIPDSIGDLIYLRYLNFSNTKIKSLPESTSLLFFLQTLSLRSCDRLIKLPSKMRYLTNLCYLDIKDTNSLKEMPPGVKELKKLQYLSKFIVSLHGGSSNLKDLKNLSFLRGELHISKLDNLTDRKDISWNILSDKRGLEVLLLEWGSEFDDSRNEDVEEIVLTALQPHKNLKELTIEYYGGSQFPSWLGDSSSLFKLVVLKLENCKNCTILPSLGALRSLEVLTIQGMVALKKLDFQMASQSLKILRLQDLQECEYWDANGENADVKKFSSLRELYMERCPKLTGELPVNLPSLEILVIWECAKLVVSFSSFPMLYGVDIRECKGLVCSSSGSTDFKSLNSVRISNIPEFGNWLKQTLSFVHKPLQGIHSLTSLKELSIYNCASLVLFPEINFLPNLSSLFIWDCKALQSLHEGMKYNNACLKNLSIGGCDSLTSIARGTLPSSLKSVDIRRCKELQCLVDDRYDRCAASSSSFSVMLKESFSTCLVEELYIGHCPSITSISSKGDLPITLKILQIGYCNSITCISPNGELPITLKNIQINYCQSITSISSKGELPITLKNLQIENCPSITCISPNSELPKALESLHIHFCSNMESIAETFDSSMCLREIHLRGCEKLKSLPSGLHNLKCLESIHILDCPNIISLQDGGPPMDSLHDLCLVGCPQIKTPLKLPDSLQSLTIQSPLLFTAEFFPINLTELRINGDVEFHKPLSELGLENLTSLRDLRIKDCPDAEPIFQEDNRIPISLNILWLQGFPNLKIISTSFASLTSLQSLTISGWPELKCIPNLGSLTSLEELLIWDCPKLKSFQGLPSSLMDLIIRGCPLLKKQCTRGKGKYWTEIHHIPCVQMDGKFMRKLRGGRMSSII